MNVDHTENMWEREYVKSIFFNIDKKRSKNEMDKADYVHE